MTASLRSVLLAVFVVSCASCSEEDPGSAQEDAPVAGLERLEVGVFGPERSRLFGHSWLDCEFGRFNERYTDVEAEATGDGGASVTVSGASIPMYEARFTFDPDGEACEVEVRWFRDSGFDDQLAGRMVVLEGYVWSSGLVVFEGEVSTHFAFKLRGLREGEPVTLGGEVLLRPN